MAQEKRRIIYVDAGQNENKEFQIALFDPDINLTSIVKPGFCNRILYI